MLRAGRREEAISFYGAAIRVHLTQANQASDEAAFVALATRAMVETFGLIAAHIEVDIDEDDRVGLYEAILRELDEEHDGFGELLRPHLQAVREELEREGVFDRLRDDPS